MCALGPGAHTNVTIVNIDELFFRMGSAAPRYP